MPSCMSRSALVRKSCRLRCGPEIGISVCRSRKEIQSIFCCGISAPQSRRAYRYLLARRTNHHTKLIRHITDSSRVPGIHALRLLSMIKSGCFMRYSAVGWSIIHRRQLSLARSALCDLDDPINAGHELHHVRVILLLSFGAALVA